MGSRHTQEGQFVRVLGPSLAPFPILAPLTPTDPEVYVHVAFSIFPQVGTAWYLPVTKEKELNIPRLVQRL